ncbi:MAG: ATPase, T2SS/T4P/T4SS family [Patescibacteria group bacterium]|jgi:type IV pilus assembly protein PilB
MNNFLVGLVEKKKITEEQAGEIEKLMSETGKSPEELIADRGILDIEDIYSQKAGFFNLPYQSLIGKKIDEKILNFIPFEAAENYQIICFDKKENEFYLGLADPGNFKAIEAVDFLAKKKGVKVKYFFISSVSFDQALKQYRSLNQEVNTALERKALEKKKDDEKEEKEKPEFQEVIKSAPVAKIVSVIIRHAVEGRASDIHIEPSAKESRVRYRIDGILHTSLIMPKDIHGAVVARIKVLSNLKLDETRIPQDGRIREVVNDKEIDFRISILPLTNDDEKVVMRILDVTHGAPELTDLGYMGEGLVVIQKNLKKTDGMMLVTGPTGSGKSTTLFSVLNKLNKEGVNISTLEDPVEYKIKGVNQSQVRQEVGFTFASGLRSLLRQDPDIVMVGEIRDNETAELAIHASLTGHFVLSTLHTNDAIGALPRLLDMKVEPFLLGSTLNIVIAQRLVRRICPHCADKYNLPKDIIAEVKATFEGIPAEIIKKHFPKLEKRDFVFIKGKGCPRCGNTGYSGRLAVAEVLDVNDKIRDIILDKSKNLSLKEAKESQLFISLKEDGVIKVLLGLTTMEEVMRIIQD